MCQWIKSYLSNRVQVFAVNDTVSPYLNIGCGVPQGSVLGPLLFSMYINDLPAATTFPLQTALFVDDTIIFASGKTTDSISSRLNAIMACVNQWLLDNGLSLNAAKSKCMLIHSRRKRPSALNIALNGSIIEQVETFKLLGVIIDHHLHWRPHIDSIVKSASRNVHLMRRLLVPTCQCSESYLFCLQCSLVWDPCCSTDSTCLQRLQNYAVRIILKVLKSSSATEALTTLKLTSLSDRQRQKLFSFSQEILQPRLRKSPPSYIRNILTKVSAVHQYQTRGATRGHLHVNQVHKEYGK